MVNGNFEVGDVVRLKHGGPHMTVVYINTYATGHVTAKWFDYKDHLYTGEFDSNSLKLIGE
jgi:uncharacterized protein YodC (DUF2158 family)